MNKLYIAVAGTMVVMTAALHLGKRASPERPPETWLENMMLTENAGYQLVPEVPGTKISYSMHPDTYKVLNPIGIACQKFQDPSGRQMDVVIIAGDSMQAFHDQRVCFKAQGWDLLSEEVRYLKTERHGTIPVTWMTIQLPGQAPKEALYAFRSPTGFQTYDQAKLGFIKAKLKDMFGEQIGYSYRFIGLTSDVDAQELAYFARTYLDNLDVSTQGVM